MCSSVVPSSEMVEMGVSSHLANQGNYDFFFSKILNLILGWAAKMEEKESRP
jgi:hypothetical protein